MIFAVVPAAGQSSRMGCAKLTLPFAGRSVLECLLTALTQGGVDHVLVVVGPLTPQLVPLAEAAGASVLLLQDQTDDMRATIIHGLNWLQERFQPAAGAAFFLVPADLPTLEPAVLHQLLRARRNEPDCSLFVPTWAGQRGHPVLIDWKHAVSIRKLPAGSGLNAYLLQQTAQTLEVPVTSSSVLCNLNTPEDYQRLLKNRPGGSGSVV